VSSESRVREPSEKKAEEAWEWVENGSSAARGSFFLLVAGNGI